MRKATKECGRSIKYIYNGVDEGCWWLRHMQKIRRKIGNMWGNNRVPMDLMKRQLAKTWQWIQLTRYV